jgi:hypothetical protein
MDSEVQQPFIVSLFHRTSTMHKQNTTSEVDKIIRRKYVYYNLHETDFHGVTVEEADLLGCYAVWSGNLFPKIRRNVLPSSSGL